MPRLKSIEDVIALVASIAKELKNSSLEKPENAVSFRDDLLLKFKVNIFGKLESVGLKFNLHLVSEKVAIAHSMADCIREETLPEIYFAFPADAHLHVLCDVVELLAEMIATPQLPVHGFNILFPSVVQTLPLTLDNGFPELAPNHMGTKGWSVPKPVNLTQLLHTHLLGENGKYLIPSKIVTTDDFLAKLTTNKIKIPNIYPALESYEDTGYFYSRSDIFNLKNHHADICNLFDLYKQITACSSDTSNLLVQIRILCEHLAFNDAHGGIGKPKDAGAGAYQAIISFNEYWRQLSIEQTDQIPLNVKDAIEKILIYSEIKEINQKATLTNQTCVANLRIALTNSIAAHGAEAILSTITLSREKQAHVVSTLIQKRDAAVHNLRLLFDSKNPVGYKGQAQSALTLASLVKLKVRINIQTPETLNRFLTELSETELKKILTVHEIKRQIAFCIRNYSHLQIALTDLSSLKQIIFLMTISNLLKARFYPPNLDSVSKHQVFTTLARFSLLLKPEVAAVLLQSLLKDDMTHLQDVCSTFHFFLSAFANRPHLEMIRKIACQAISSCIKKERSLMALYSFIKTAKSDTQFRNMYSNEVTEQFILDCFQSIEQAIEDNVNTIFNLKDLVQFRAQFYLMTSDVQAHLAKTWFRVLSNFILELENLISPLSLTVAKQLLFIVSYMQPGHCGWILFDSHIDAIKALLNSTLREFVNVINKLNNPDASTNPELNNHFSWLNKMDATCLTYIFEHLDSAYLLTLLNHHSFLVELKHSIEPKYACKMKLVKFISDNFDSLSITPQNASVYKDLLMINGGKLSGHIKRKFAEIDSTLGDLAVSSVKKPKI